MCAQPSLIVRPALIAQQLFDCEANPIVAAKGPIPRAPPPHTRHRRCAIKDSCVIENVCAQT